MWCMKTEEVCDRDFNRLGRRSRGRSGAGCNSGAPATADAAGTGRINLIVSAIRLQVQCLASASPKGAGRRKSSGSYFWTG